MLHLKDMISHCNDKKPPIIIIGAARSGTKMLRAVLAASSEFVDFPYDINYIWKYGNYNIDHDELTPEDLSERTRAFIQNKFNKLLSQSSAKRVLEKSVPNSLRIGFVRAVFPDCKIIHLYRDGRDVAADARLCWQASATDDMIQSKHDLFKKIIDFPYIFASPYLLNHLKIYVSRKFSGKEHVSSWGPRFKGIRETIKEYSLLEVCGIQWSKSIESSLRDLLLLDEGNDFINIRYEDFVQEPLVELEKIRDFLQVDDFDSIMKSAEKVITPKFVGFWKETITQEEMNSLLPHIKKHLSELGYK